MLSNPSHFKRRLCVAMLLAAGIAAEAVAQDAGGNRSRPPRRLEGRARPVQNTPNRDRGQAGRPQERPRADRAQDVRPGDRAPGDRPANERLRRAAAERRAAQRDGAPDRPDHDGAQRLGRRSGIRGDLNPDELDRRPLEDGEAPRLMEFARGRFAEVHQRLEQTERRNPEEFRQQLQRFAPRLRFLKRLEQEHPRLARIMMQRIGNEQRIQRYRRAWDNAPPETRRRILREARERIAENLRLESDVLRLQAERVRESREQRVERWFQHLVKPGSDLAHEPPAVRELVEGIHAAPADSRATLEGELRDYVGAELDDELAAIEERLRRRDEMRAEEVDMRLRRMFGLP
jgi:hypothetical protein